MIWDDITGLCYLEIAQKVIEGDRCHMITYASDFEIAQNSNRLVSFYFLLAFESIWNQQIFLIFVNENFSIKYYIYLNWWINRTSHFVKLNLTLLFWNKKQVFRSYYFAELLNKNYISFVAYGIINGIIIYTKRFINFIRLKSDS